MPETPVPAASSETVFYFVRHGETEYNRKGIVQGRKINSHLNATGRAQAKRLAARFAEVKLDAIYTSTLHRAMETAAPLVSERPGVPVHHLEALEEMSWGVYEGKPATGAVLDAFEAIKTAWRGGAFGRTVEGGESILDVQARALDAVRLMTERHAGGTLLVVTHGRFLRILIASLLGEYGLERMHEVAHANTGVNHLVLRADAYEAKLLNCTAHLEKADLEAQAVPQD